MFDLRDEKLRDFPSVPQRLRKPHQDFRDFARNDFR